MKSSIQIVKASGERALFSVHKLKNSLRRSGATESAIEEVVKEIEGQLYDGMATRKIYQLAFKILRKKNRTAASKYKLKKAIMELGPSGFAFEKYLSEIFKATGHHVQLDLIMNGRCVNHEVDILAEKDGIQKIIECKYHNLEGTICDVKIPLYVHSRFKDIAENLPGKNSKEGWVATNTRFSTDAIQYAACSNLKLLGWDYPSGNGLREIIDEVGLYPITCLTTLSQKEKMIIMESGLLLTRDILGQETLLQEIGIAPGRIAIIIQEAARLSESMKKIEKETTNNQ